MYYHLSKYFLQEPSKKSHVQVELQKYFPIELSRNSHPTSEFWCFILPVSFSKLCPRCALALAKSAHVQPMLEWREEPFFFLIQTPWTLVGHVL